LGGEPGGDSRTQEPPRALRLEAPRFGSGECEAPGSGELGVCLTGKQRHEFL